MANEEHLKILAEGVETWNKWRRESLEIVPDFGSARLDDANLRNANLRNAYLSFAYLDGAIISDANLVAADLSNAHLKDANLSGADLSRAYLSSAHLNRAYLQGADLSYADLIYTDFSGANLSRAHLNSADLKDANLSGAYLRDADLSGANFSRTDLQDADFLNAIMKATVFADTDLSVARGLKSVRHQGPSYVSIDTLYRSAGNIPDSFMRGSGIPEVFITYSRSLVGKPIEFYSCFISYSNKNYQLAERLHADLQNKGVRCWFAPEDLKIGDRYYERIEESIRKYDKVLIILSEDSISSRWVEREVNAALENEEKQDRTILFPIRLDEVVMNSDKSWASDIRRSRHIGDFTRWKDHDSYQEAFDRLLRDLRANEARGELD